MEWARTVSPEARDALSKPENLRAIETHLKELQTDGLGVSQRIAMQAIQDPANRARFDQWLSSMGYVKAGAQSAPAASQPAVDAEPQPDLQQGEYKWYSHEQQAKRDAWLQRQMESRFDKRLAPFEAAEKTRQAEADKQRQAAEVQAWSQKHFSAVSKLPHFEANKDEIAKVFAAMPFTTVEDLAANVRDAYHQVVMPKLTGQARTDVLSELEKKAKAGTVVPRTGVSGTPAATSGKPDFASALKAKFAANA